MRLALFCGDSDTATIVANRLTAEFGDFPILLEEKESRSIFLKRRVRRLGLSQVLGQIAFMMLINPVLRRRSEARRQEIVQNEGLELSRDIFAGAQRVKSINGTDVEAWLRDYQPDVVVVNGTRIIAKRILNASDAVFINTHCGITPKYRGSHGGYWARVNCEPQNCGVTVHLVDPGIDTGDIIGQQPIHPTDADNITTYPLLQIAAALPILIAAVKGSRSLVPAQGESAMWYHPTIWSYFWAGITRGAW